MFVGDESYEKRIWYGKSYREQVQNTLVQIALISFKCARLSVPRIDQMFLVLHTLILDNLAFNLSQAGAMAWRISIYVFQLFNVEPYPSLFAGSDKSSVGCWQEWL